MGNVTGFLRFLISFFKRYIIHNFEDQVKTPTSRWENYNCQKEFDINKVNSRSISYVKKYHLKMFFIYFGALLIASLLEIRIKGYENDFRMILIYAGITFGLPTFTVFFKYRYFIKTFADSVMYAWTLLLKDNKIDDSLKMINEVIQGYPMWDIFKSIKIMTLLFSGNLTQCAKYCLTVKDNQLLNMEDKNVIDNTMYIIDYLNCVNLEKDYIPKFDSYPNMPLNETYELANIISVKYGELQGSIVDKCNAFVSSPIHFCKSMGYLLMAEETVDEFKMDSFKGYIEKALEYSPSEEVTECIQKHIEAMNTQSL